MINLLRKHALVTRQAQEQNGYETEQEMTSTSSTTPKPKFYLRDIDPAVRYAAPPGHIVGKSPTSIEYTLNYNKDKVTHTASGSQLIIVCATARAICVAGVLFSRLQMGRRQGSVLLVSPLGLAGRVLLGAGDHARRSINAHVAGRQHGSVRPPANVRQLGLGAGHAAHGLGARRQVRAMALQLRSYHSQLAILSTRSGHKRIL